MIADLKPYPVMKDSGVEWLGEVPEHWEVRRGKNILHCIDVRSETGEEELLTVSSERGVVPRRSANVTMFKAESYVGYKLCWPGDLVINSLWAWARGLGVSKYHGIISTAYGVYRPKKTVDAKFIHELVRSTLFHWELRTRSKGIWTSRLQLTDNSFLDAPFPLPSLKEQTAIARFMDHVDRRVRRYVRAQQKLIGLLEEQKQAIIHHAVTRGLDSGIRFKSSGVEWLGDVPEHWKVLRSKYVFREVDQRSTIGQELHLSMSQKYGLIPSSQMEERRLISESYAGAKLCDTGDLVLNRLKAHLGVCALAPERGLVSQDYTVFRAVRNTEPRYFELLYRTPACRIEFQRRTKGIVQGFWRLYTDDFYDIRVPVPPLPDQKAIVNALDPAIVRADRAIASIQRSIELIREYRTRLIDDVLTGKLDVRAAAANMPDELDEPEALEDVDALNEEEENGDLEGMPGEAEA